MKKILLALVVACSLSVGLAAHAAESTASEKALTITQDMVSPEVWNSIKEKTEAAKAITAGLPTTEDLKWGATFGKEVGTTIVSTARELGIGVGEFLQTTGGKVVLAFIIYKLVGATVLWKTAAVAWLVGMLFMWFRFYKKFVGDVLPREETYVEGKLSKIIYVDRDKWSADQQESVTARTFFFYAGLALIIFVGTMLVFV